MQEAKVAGGEQAGGLIAMYHVSFTANNVYVIVNAFPGVKSTRRQFYFWNNEANATALDPLNG